jgi:hypothetical protein
MDRTWLLATWRTFGKKVRADRFVLADASDEVTLTPEENAW